jgi:glutathione S-transferase
MLKIWGRLTSINVQKAMFCIEEIGLQCERVDAGLHFGVNSTPDYLAMNPNGLVPTLRDGDLTLWESNVIVRYLAAKHSAGVLWPEDPGARATADRWMDWQQTSLWPAMHPVFHGLVRSPGSRTPTDIEAGIARADALFGMLDAHLAARGALACGRFTMADCVIGPAVHRWLAMPVPRTPRPTLEGWYAALMQRPAAVRNLILPLA